jgi:hypothetical protein
MSRMHTCAATLCLGVAMAVLFPPLGCGGSPARRDAEVPGSVAFQLQRCAAEHTHLRDVRHSVSYDVKLARDGSVDAVALRDSTLSDEGLEACMAGALRSLSLDDLPLRRAELGRRGPVSAESRALLGQEEILLGCIASPPCLLTGLVLVGGIYISVQLYVYAMSRYKPRTAPTATTAPPSPVDLDECIANYVKCTDWTPRAPCYICMGFCQANKRWDPRCPLPM